MAQNGDFSGFFHIYGGGVDRTSQTQFWGPQDTYEIHVGRDLPNGSLLCAEGWEKFGDRFELRGRPCMEIRF
ncbi:hypothetical protein OG897_31275 [Streptomyces sp. NBC_00237]|uniref:hypothetical protein n=1 Tax=Streptomyces sp. NBC_00237 TaxID=2975687 RepID=UPI00224CFB99|nr:hypothetical protein [Streptomyces sp. NBC_00237]MCX5205898.1 hypothetical protein [Streptomyces sp. NBC_00237]